MKTYNKLVRDKIPEFLDSKGIPYEKRIATEEEYGDELFKKLKEEVEEFILDKTENELADIIEVVEAIKELPEFKNIDEVRQEKLNSKGGFKNKFIVSGIDDR